MGDNSKIILEGYFCHSHSKDEEFDYEYYLCKFPAITIPPEMEWERDNRVVMPDETKLGDFFDIDEELLRMKLGKRYRITIEAVPDGDATA